MFNFLYKKVTNQPAVVTSTLFDLTCQGNNASMSSTVLA